MVAVMGETVGCLGVLGFGSCPYSSRVHLESKTGSWCYPDGEITYQVLICVIVTGKEQSRVHGVLVIGATMLVTSADRACGSI